MQNAIIDGIKTLVEVYRRETGASLATVSKLVYRNTSFLKDFFDRRRSIGVNSLEQVITRLTDAWPPGIPWPDVPSVPFLPDVAARENAAAEKNVPKKRKRRQ